MNRKIIQIYFMAFALKGKILKIVKEKVVSTDLRSRSLRNAANHALLVHEITDRSSTHKPFS